MWKSEKSLNLAECKLPGKWAQRARNHTEKQQQKNSRTPRSTETIKDLKTLVVFCSCILFVFRFFSLLLRYKHFVLQWNVPVRFVRVINDRSGLARRYATSFKPDVSGRVSMRFTRSSMCIANCIQQRQPNTRNRKTFPCVNTFSTDWCGKSMMRLDAMTTDGMSLFSCTHWPLPACIERQIVEFLVNYRTFLVEFGSGRPFSMTFR